MDELKYADETEPDLKGPFGKAWKADVPSLLTRHPEEIAKAPASIAGWYVFAPRAHPFWSYYGIACISLTVEIKGVPAPKIYKEGATHEIFVAALNPDMRPAINETYDFLTPLNFSGQFIAESDEDARAKVEFAIKEIVNGLLNPDTDFISQWVERFGASNLKHQRNFG